MVERKCSSCFLSRDIFIWDQNFMHLKKHTAGRGRFFHLKKISQDIFFWVDILIHVALLLQRVVASKEKRFWTNVTFFQCKIQKELEIWPLEVGLLQNFKFHHIFSISGNPLSPLKKPSNTALIMRKCFTALFYTR